MLLVDVQQFFFQEIFGERQKAFPQHLYFLRYEYEENDFGLRYQWIYFKVLSINTKNCILSKNEFHALANCFLVIKNNLECVINFKVLMINLSSKWTSLFHKRVDQLLRKKHTLSKLLENCLICMLILWQTMYLSPVIFLLLFFFFFLFF